MAQRKLFKAGIAVILTGSIAALLLANLSSMRDEKPHGPSKRERRQGGRTGKSKPKVSAKVPPKGNADSFIETTEIGKSVKGRPIVAVRIGRGEKRVLFVAATHGDEYGGEVADQFIEYLMKNPDAVPKNTEVHVIPRLNPDGWETVTRGNAHNVDINRNFPVDWSPKVDAGDDSGRAGNTPGPRPASEPETRALMNFLKKGFARVISIHSLGGIIDYDGPGKELAIAMAKASPRYLVDTTDYSGSSSGSLGKYVPKAYKIPVITIELESDHLDRVLDALLVAIRW